MSGGTDPTESDLIDLLGSPQAADRAWAAQLLGRDPSPRAVAALSSRLEDPDPAVRGFAAQSLAIAGEQAALSKMIELVDADDGSTPSQVAWAIIALIPVADEGQRRAANAAIHRLYLRASPDVEAQLELLMPDIVGSGE